MYAYDVITYMCVLYHLGCHSNFEPSAVICLCTYCII